MAILREASDNPADFEVRGRHPTVYPVDLPPWLPINIVNSMLTRFKALLRKELVEMLAAAKASEEKGEAGDSSSTRHHHTQSGLSDISDMSGMHLMHPSGKLR